jgi:hypothetical protein
MATWGFSLDTTMQVQLEADIILQSHRFQSRLNYAEKLEAKFGSTEATYNPSVMHCNVLTKKLETRFDNTGATNDPSVVHGNAHTEKMETRLESTEAIDDPSVMQYNTLTHIGELYSVMIGVCDRVIEGCIGKPPSDGAAQCLLVCIPMLQVFLSCTLSVTLVLVRFRGTLVRSCLLAY